MGGFSLCDRRLTRQQRRPAPPVEEIEGLIRVYRDGQVERLPVVRDVPCAPSPEPGVTSADFVIDQPTRLWARLYVPARPLGSPRLPLLVYFHGGGFCVGSAAWSCYHGFLSRLAAKAGCAVASVNYRLAPEHRLPTAHEDGVRAVKWVRRQGGRGGDEATRWWSGRCDRSRLFVGGDSAGATIAYHVASQFPTALAGAILIQPFFGGEERTSSEGTLAQPPGSALTLAASDAYWRLALPTGASRDHPWCNPASVSASRRRLPRLLVCVAELDVLRDREVEFCRATRAAGGSVEMVVHGGVGHAFHVLHGSRLAQRRRQELVDQIRNFIASRR